MAFNREVPSILSIPVTRVAASVCVCLAVSGCNNAGNSIAKFVQADQAQARLNTQIAREKALNRVAQPTHRPNIASNTAVTSTKVTEAKVANNTFSPNFFRMFQRGTVGKPTQFQKPVAVAAAAPAQQPFPENQTVSASVAGRQVKKNEAAIVVANKPEQADNKEASKTVAIATQIVEQAPRFDASKPMAKFRSKLAALKSGARTKPVTVVHIGDSHIASDSFTQGIRRALQAEFGDAGRGTVVPAGAFKYAFTDQLKQKKSGPWRADTALKNRKGSFGLAGVSMSSASTSAKLAMTTKTGAFDAVTVTVATGPKQGSFVVRVGDTAKKFSAKSASRSSKTFKLAGQGKTAIVSPAGGGVTRVYSWGTQKNQPGVRYANLGLIGATVNITKRFDTNLVKNDIRALDPDLIVYGYGTNEGFNDNLNLKRYTKYASNYIDTLLSAAPNAEVVIIGASDGLRRRSKGGKSCGGGWYEPPKLSPLRNAMKQLASDRSMGYWDWSIAMGGKCSANRWAAKGLAARDRVHLSSKGYRRSAAAFASWLAGDQTKPVKVALGN